MNERLLYDADQATAPRASEPVLSCPSAPVEEPGARVFGVAVGTETEPRIAYLDVPQPVTPELLAMAEGLPPDKVFRAVSLCSKGKCVHYEGSRCSLGTRIATTFAVVTEQLPPCSIRKDCRWFAENHVAACLRCPQVVTETPALLGSAEPAAWRTFKKHLPLL